MNAQIPNNWQNQELHLIEHPSLGKIGAIVIDSLALGPAMGGCRFWSYPALDDAILDARRLARGMSYKNALAGLPLGGGKSVIMKPDGDFPRAELFKAFGETVCRLSGRYLTAEDVGTNPADMAVARKAAPWVFGVSADNDPSPWTALGVFVSIEAVARKLGISVSGSRIAIQGLGHVGMHLAQRLHDAGAKLIVADVNVNNAQAAAERFGATIVDPNEIHKCEAEIFAPCALGAGLNRITIPQIKALAVVGSANNQLETEQDGDALAERGIVYAPDYVVNAGGVINVAAEYFGEDTDKVRRKVMGIGDRLIDVLAKAETLGISANKAADHLAEDMINAADAGNRKHSARMR